MLKFDPILFFHIIYILFYNPLLIPAYAEHRVKLNIMQLSCTSFRISDILEKAVATQQLLLYWNPAASYSPGPFPAKYHRR